MVFCFIKVKGVGIEGFRIDYFISVGNIQLKRIQDFQSEEMIFEIFKLGV